MDDWLDRVLDPSHLFPVIVQFSASWCQPCQILRPLLEKEVEDRDGAVHYCYVDAGKNGAFADLMKVSYTKLFTTDGLRRGSDLLQNLL